MNVPQEKLDELAQKAYRVNSHLLGLQDALRASDVPSDVQEQAATARRVNNSLLNGLVSVGAEDPLQAVSEHERRDRQERGLPTSKPKETPLALLTSDAARRYTEAIRAAAVACLEMERERGIEDGLGEILSDYADIAEMECYGPVGLRGME